MGQTINVNATPDVREEQDAFALACFRAIGSASDDSGPWDSVRDWNQALLTLEIHGLLPFFAHADCGSAPLPDDVRQLALVNKLRAATYQSNALDAMNDVSRELGAAGVPYALLKGTYLYEFLYRDLFPRAYGDIDLLVPANRMAEATAALDKAGYDSDSKPGEHASMPLWHFHVTLTSRKPGGLPIEMHRSLVDRFNLYRIPEGELFGRLKEFKGRQGSFTVLCAEDQLIYLCLHVAKHGVLNFVGLRSGFPATWFCSPATGNRLLWFLDIDLFLRKQRDILDWGIVSDRIRRWNIADEVVDCLRVLQLLLPGSPAEDAIQRLGHPRHARATRHGAYPRWLLAKRIRSWLEGSMRMHPRFFFRPIRCFLIGHILMPSPRRILGYHGKINPLWLPWLYLTHPFRMIRKMLGSP